MSLFGALSSSVIGLNAQSEVLSVISDNLSNVNTTGYKANRVLFSQLVTSSGSAGSFNSGGVDTSVLRNQNQQGSFITTQNATDLAISGNGFFIVNDTVTSSSETSIFYTRAGAFAENSAGFLVTPSGHYLQGYETESDGTIVDNLLVESIALNSVGASAKATASLELGANLNSATTIGDYDTTAALTTTLDALVAAPTNADFVIDSRFYDAQGTARDVSFLFNKRGDNFWDFTAYTDGGNLLTGTSGTDTRIGNGTVRFNQDGSLKYISGDSISVNWNDGVPAGTIALDFGEYSGGLLATAGAGLTYTDDVLDVAIDSTTLSTANTYAVRWNDADTLEIHDGTSVIGSADVTATSTVRTLEFLSGGSPIGVRITLNDTFATAGTGPYPEAVGNFTLATQAASGAGDGTDGLIQFASTSNTIFATQDGFGSGTLGGVSVDADGFVIGSFTNGESKKLYKLAIGIFQNPAGLAAASGTLLTETDQSGSVLIKEANVGGTGGIVSGSLEQSTADIANEFSQMIVTQRAFQANSTIISTADQMLNELLQLR